MTARNYCVDVADDTWIVRESTRRRRTLTAFREGGRVVVVVPAHMSARDRREHIPALVDRFLAKEARRRPPRGDEELTRRAVELYEGYVAPATGQRTPPLGVRWVDTMATRWASCTVTTGEIRVSDRLRDMPDWVVDYVLLHEVVHLVEPSHSARFWSLVGSYPLAERARGYLEGFQAAGGGTAAGGDGGSAADGVD